MIIKEDFWDAVNYHKENLVPFGEWKQIKDLPSEITETVLKNFRTMVRMIKNDPRFRIITYSQLANEIAKEETRVVKMEHISELYASLKENERLCTLKDALGYLPEHAMDEYGIALKDIGLYAEYGSVRVLPEDTVLCILRQPLIGECRKDDVYDKQLQMMQALVSFGKES